MAVLETDGESRAPGCCDDGVFCGWQMARSGGTSGGNGDVLFSVLCPLEGDLSRDFTTPEAEDEGFGVKVVLGARGA